MTAIEIKKMIYDELKISEMGFQAIDGAFNIGDFVLLKQFGESIGMVRFAIDFRGNEANWGYLFSYSKYFPAVNEILVTFFPKKEISDPYGIGEMEVTIKWQEKEFFEVRALADTPAGIQNFIEDGVFYKERLIETSAIRKEIIERYALPFFEQYTTLQQVNDNLINTIPQMKLGRIIPGKMSLKKLIIMSLCNNPNYDEYKSWYFNIVKSDYESGDPESQFLYPKLVELISYLENIK